MELVFVCPPEAVSLSTQRWVLQPGYRVVEDAEGRRLEGTVAVSCPVCGQEHLFAVQEVSCPFAEGLEGEIFSGGEP